MEKLVSTEFYNTPGRECMVKNADGLRILSQSDRKLIEPMFQAIKEQAPEKFNYLCNKYAASKRNVIYFQFLVVNRFVKCNMGEYDLLSMDIDEFGMFHLENVKCPLQGECVDECHNCKLKKADSMSPIHKEILRLKAEGLTEKEIAERMFRSPYTIGNHVDHIRKKYDLHSAADLVRFYYISVC